MNHKERFRAMFNGEPVDRIPVYFFGTWHETKARWKNEGLDTVALINSDPGPQVPDMDPDWEVGLWDCHGLINSYAIGNISPLVLEETAEYIIQKTSLGDIIKGSKIGSSISYAIEHGLEPTRESWEKYKSYLNPNDPDRYNTDWEQKADELNKKDRVIAFMGGSLYGWLRGFMGIENLSCLMYDDPELLEEMVSYMTDYFMVLFEKLVKKVRFDFVYFFEDCCGADGPLFSPAIYKSIFDKHYQRLINFYKENGVPFALIDSDGKVEKFIPLWLNSGFDIIFPLEVGTWEASPVKLRKQFGSRLKMLGGINKHVITKGEIAIREHLMEVKAVVKEGGFIPIPDHRIPPDCSYKEFLTYIRIYNEIFNS